MTPPRGWRRLARTLIPALAMTTLAAGLAACGSDADAAGDDGSGGTIRIAYSSLVAAETVNGLPGLGGMIRDAQTYLQSDVVILGLFAIGLSGLLIDGCLRAVERRLLPWRGRG